MASPERQRTKKTQSGTLPRMSKLMGTVGWILLYCFIIIAALLVVVFVVFLATPSSKALASEAPVTVAVTERRYLTTELGKDHAILPSDVPSMRSTYVSINRLANADTTLDSTLVTFRGEVVGDVLASATTGRRWITMQATSGARATIGVLMDETQIALISYYGAYQTKGTTLLVTGIYRVADDNETGTLDVTAYDVSVVEEGGYHPQKITISKLYVGGALTFVGITLLVVGFVLKRRNRA